MSLVRCCAAAAFCVALSMAFWARAAEISVERSEAGAVVKIDGELFTEYRIASGAKPILWPIIGPTGKPVTRAYPMAGQAGEKKDHPHQRSLWFTHGDVGGVSFWEEGAKVGTVKHREFLKLEGEKRPTIATRNDWLAPGGRKICEDRRTLRFGASNADARWIDFEIALRASEGPVRFGDTKEGSFGLRVAESLSVDAKQGGKIVNSEGKTDAAAWGKRAAWVDYHGPIDGETVGIAVFNHPTSFRYPTYWHVRTYGLFAANPFGVKEFEGRGDGATELPSGETMTLRYRVYIHRGDERSAGLKEAFSSYSEEVF